MRGPKGPLPAAELAPEFRVRSLVGELDGVVQRLPDLGVEAGLVLVVIRQRAVNPGEREMGVLEMNFLGAPAVGDFVEDDLGDLHLRPGDPGDARSSISIWVANAAGMVCC